MAYNRRNLLERIVEIQEIILREKKRGFTQQHIFETLIKPQYRISLATLNNYLGINAKKELAQMQDDDKRIENLKDKAYKLYVVDRLPMREVAKKLGVTHYQMNEIAIRYNLKIQRFEKKANETKKETLNKEHKKCDKLRLIIEIQGIASRYPDKPLKWIYDEFICHQYEISLQTFSSYMKRPAKEELKEVLERQKYREQAAKARRLQLGQD